MSTERSLFPSVVSSCAGWCEPQFRCNRHCQEEGFHYFDTASVMVERRAVHDRPLPKLLPLEARRDERAGVERQAVETPLVEEVARQIGSWPWHSELPAQDHDLRDLWKEAADALSLG